MNHLIAKIKLRGNGPKYKKMISGDTIFVVPNEVGAHIKYSPDHKLDEDSWFGIEEFSKKDFCLDFLKETFDSVKYETLNNIDVDKLDFICSYQNNNEYYFQNITKSQLVTKKVLHLTDVFRYEENNKTIVINTIPDAKYLKDKDILYFKRLTSISNIFNGIDELYREATKEEIINFLESDFVKLEGDFSEAKVGKANRQRIAMALDTLTSLEEEEKGKVMEYIQGYCPDLEYKNDEFKIKSNEELKKLLYGIEQRYYTTPISNEKVCANSIIKL